mmetsp:Transcript_55742/g.121361  ORF Transcript_55742/g.121361 Transcript_55742/m.121361 type:complete len:335 (+) Transcript_55742:1155-2159(+)
MQRHKGKDNTNTEARRCQVESIATGPRRLVVSLPLVARLPSEGCGKWFVKAGVVEGVVKGDVLLPARSLAPDVVFGRPSRPTPPRCPQASAQGSAQGGPAAFSQRSLDDHACTAYTPTHSFRRRHFRRRVSRPTAGGRSFSAKPQFISPYPLPPSTAPPTRSTGNTTSHSQAIHKKKHTHTFRCRGEDIERVQASSCRTSSSLLEHLRRASLVLICTARRCPATWTRSGPNSFPSLTTFLRVSTFQTPAPQRNTVVGIDGVGRPDATQAKPVPPCKIMWTTVPLDLKLVAARLRRLVAGNSDSPHSQASVTGFHTNPFLLKDHCDFVEAHLAAV